MGLFSGLIDNTIGRIPGVGGQIAEVINPFANIASAPLDMMTQIQGQVSGMLFGGTGGGQLTQAGPGAVSTGSTETILLVGGAGLVVLFLLIR